MALPDPSYDLAGALEALTPGLRLSRELVDAGAARYAAKGFAPLVAADIAGILAAANTLDLPKTARPADNGDPDTTATRYPASLPATLGTNGYTFAGQIGNQVPVILGTLRRFPDSNPEAQDLAGTSRNRRVVGG